MSNMSCDICDDGGECECERTEVRRVRGEVCGVESSCDSRKVIMRWSDEVLCGALSGFKVHDFQRDGSNFTECVTK